MSTFTRKVEWSWTMADSRQYTMRVIEQIWAELSHMATKHNEREIERHSWNDYGTTDILSRYTVLALRCVIIDDVWDN